MLDDCQQNNTVQECIVEGRTTLVKKHRSKGNEVRNYWSIACLNLILKALTGKPVGQNIYVPCGKQFSISRPKRMPKRIQEPKDNLVIVNVMMKTSNRTKNILFHSVDRFQKDLQHIAALVDFGKTPQVQNS